MSNPRPPFFDQVLLLAGAVNSIPDPQDARGFLVGGILANLLGHIREDQWRGMLASASAPCGEPGCECHIIRGRLMEVLNDERDEWKEVVAQQA